MSEENKPCRFCGGKKISAVCDSLTGLWAIACETCITFYGVSNTQEEAWEKWNNKLDRLEQRLKHE